MSDRPEHQKDVVRPSSREAEQGVEAIIEISVTKGSAMGHFFKTILAGSRDAGTPGRVDPYGRGFHLLYLANGPRQGGGFGGYKIAGV